MNQVQLHFSALLQKVPKHVALFWALAATYVVCMVQTYDAAYAYHMGTGLLGPLKHASWWTEAVPWVISCLLAVALAMYTPVFRNRASQLLAVLSVSAVITLWLATEPVTYSRDIFRYLWDGRLLLHHFNPYQYVPLDPHLSPLHSWRYWDVMDWKNWPEAYPPFAQLYFWVSAMLTNGTVLPYKLLSLANAAASAALMYAVIAERRRQKAPGSGATVPPRTPSRRRWGSRLAQQADCLTDEDVRQFGLFVLFPPLLVEAYGAGHVDAFVIPWLLVTWLCCLRRKPVGTGIALALATAIKVYPIVLFPAFFGGMNRRERANSVTAFSAALVTLYLPFWSAGRGLLSYFGHVTQLQYNGSFEPCLAYWLGPSVDKHSTLVVLAMELAAWWLVLFTKFRDLPLERKVCLLTLTFLLASPVMHPWYTLGLLPFAVVIVDMASLWLAVCAHLTYDEFALASYVEYLPTYWWYVLHWWRGAREPSWRPVNE